MLFSRTAIIPIWLLVFALLMLFGSAMTLPQGLGPAFGRMFEMAFTPCIPWNLPVRFEQPIESHRLRGPHAAVEFGGHRDLFQLLRRHAFAQCGARPRPLDEV